MDKYEVKWVLIKEYEDIHCYSSSRTAPYLTRYVYVIRHDDAYSSYCGFIVFTYDDALYDVGYDTMYDLVR